MSYGNQEQIKYKVQIYLPPKRFSFLSLDFEIFFFSFKLKFLKSEKTSRTQSIANQQLPNPNPSLCFKRTNLRSNTLFLSLSYRDIINPSVQTIKICQRRKQFVYAQSLVSLCRTKGYIKKIVKRKKKSLFKTLQTTASDKPQFTQKYTIFNIKTSLLKKRFANYLVK